MTSRGWMTTHSGKQKKNSSVKRNASDAFANDWGSYENRSVHTTAVPLPKYSNRSNTANLEPSTNISSIRNKSSFHMRTDQRKRQFIPPEFDQNSRNANLSNIATNLPPRRPNPKPSFTLSREDCSSLSLEQKCVVESVLSGHSTFFSGPAGSGKSHVLSTILKINDEGRLVKKKRIVVTATTGISACNISGTTIHSFAGIGTGDAPLNEMVGRVMGNDYARQRWRNVDILVIDEISMMPAAFLDNLDFIAKRARNDRRAFGGIQLVVCGDFFQLPPVNLIKNKFCFEAKCWSTVIKSSILLKQIFRQNGDATLMNILNEARIGQLSCKSANILREHSFKKNPKSKIKPTILECRNKQVDYVNFNELAKLSGESVTFTSKDYAVSKGHDAQLKNCSAPQKLSLKVGAQVILLKNLDPENGLVNGSRGIIVDFQRHPKASKDLPKEFRTLKLPVVQFETIGKAKTEIGNDSHDEDAFIKIIEPYEYTNRIGQHIVSSRTQIPLRLAWALSVHKSQGMTIPHLSVSLEGVFEYGQAYVALSRATTLTYLSLKRFNEKAFKAHPKVKAFYIILESESKDLEEKENNKCNSSSNSMTHLSTDICKAKHSVDCDIVTSKDKQKPLALTEEQRKRSEENKKRALELRRKNKN